MRSRGGELVESRDVSLIFVAPPIAIEVFFSTSQSQPSTAYATFTSALPPVDIYYFSNLFFVRISPNHLFTCDSLASILNKISKRWPRLQATWLIMIGFLKFELYGLSLSFHSSRKLWACFSSHGQNKLAWGLKPEKPKRRYKWSWLMSIATTDLDIIKIKGSAIRLYCWKHQVLRTLDPSNIYNRPFPHSTPVSKA